MLLFFCTLYFVSVLLTYDYCYVSIVRLLFGRNVPNDKIQTNSAVDLAVVPNQHLSTNNATVTPSAVSLKGNDSLYMSISGTLN